MQCTIYYSILHILLCSMLYIYSALPTILYYNLLYNKIILRNCILKNRSTIDLYEYEFIFIVIINVIKKNYLI